MLCQHCQKREATRHESVLKDDGAWNEVHLCDQCADTGEVSVMTPASLVQALLEGATALSGAKPLAPGRPCPKCGITYAEFRAKGRLGCPHDYEVFQPELAPLLERIHHGGLQHTGKSPASTDGRSDADREMIDLRRSLTDAVQGERYEEAARLRDRIRILDETKAAVPPEPPVPPAPGPEPPTPPAAPPKKGRPRGGKK